MFPTGFAAPSGETLLKSTGSIPRPPLDLCRGRGIVYCFPRCFRVPGDSQLSHFLHRIS